jgi:hypothetical protein
MSISFDKPFPIICAECRVVTLLTEIQAGTGAKADLAGLGT